MGVRQTLRFIARHPLTRDRPVPAIARYCAWQVRSRLQDDVTVPWIDGATLVARRGMHGATGNIYCGLHEFADMAFVMDLLRPGDLFVDVGANVGSYSVLAAGVCGADVVAVEADPETNAWLSKNIRANGVDDRVQTHELAVSSASGTVRFTIGRDATNRVASSEDATTRCVPAITLDELLRGRHPTMIKLDLEGHEPDAIAAAERTLASPNLLAVATESAEDPVGMMLRSAGFER
jgi:FkbM family methyltransferase